MTKWNEKYPDRIRRNGLILTNHARQRMTERQLRRKQIKQVIERGVYEWQYKSLIRYSFAPHMTHPRTLRWARQQMLDDVVVLVGKQKGCIVTVYRESEPDPVFSDLFPENVPPPTGSAYRWHKKH